jgi:hypothetical protein
LGRKKITVLASYKYVKAKDGKVEVHHECPSCEQHFATLSELNVHFVLHQDAAEIALESQGTPKRSQIASSDV